MYPASDNRDVSDTEVSMHSWERGKHEWSRSNAASTEVFDDVTTLGAKIPRHVFKEDKNGSNPQPQRPRRPRSL